MVVFSHLEFACLIVVLIFECCVRGDAGGWRAFGSGRRGLRVCHLVVWQKARGLYCDRKGVPTRGPVRGPKKGGEKGTEVGTESGTEMGTEMGTEKQAHVAVMGVLWATSSVPLLQFFP